MTAFYETNPDDPEAPIELDTYGDLHPGTSVMYDNPYMPGGLDGPLVITRLYLWPDLNLVQAVLNDGELEVNADILRALP